MRKSTDSSEAVGQYAIAYAAHYIKRDLPRALQLYRAILKSHSESVEATYCRMQLQNLINSVVPKQDREDAQISLLLHCFEQNETSIRETDSFRTHTSKLSV